MDRDTDIIETAVFIPYAPTSGTPNKWYAFMCKMTMNKTEGKYTPYWYVYDHTAAMIDSTSDNTKILEDATLLTATSNSKISMKGNEIAKGTAVNAAPNMILAATGYSFTWGEKETFANLDKDAKVFTCQISLTKVEADASTAKGIYDTI